MWEEILKAIPVYLASMVKFILGPVGGYTAQLNLITTILSTVFGMMTVVFVFTYSGNWFREKVLSRFIKKRKRFSGWSRRFVMIWKKYGLVGVALLTPIILTPIGGTLLAISSGSPKDKIIFLYVHQRFLLVCAVQYGNIFFRKRDLAGIYPIAVRLFFLLLTCY